MKLVLFLNMGGVSKREDCELFLKNMFNDKYILTIKSDILRSFVAFFITKFRAKKMWQNYLKIGGKSPLNDISARLCEKLNAEFLNQNLKNNAKKMSQNSALNSKTHHSKKGENSKLLAKENKNLKSNSQVKFDFINTYVPPFASEVLSKYELTKDDEIVLFPLYPHHSQTTVLSSLECVKGEILKAQIQARVSEIPVFFESEIYNEMLIKHILKANETYKKVHKKTLIFSAHSIPVSTIKAGDIYQTHIERHFALLKERLKPYFKDIVLGYQSKLGPVKWLEPSTSELLAQLTNEALVYPLSFCVDCSETAFELEIEYRKIAAKDYKVIACPNDSAEFVEFVKAYLKDR